MTVERRPRLGFVALALVATFLLATGCRSGGGSAEPPAAPEKPRAVTCPPVAIDDATARVWVDALQDFIALEQIKQGCILVRDGECIQDPPASVLDGLRERVPATRSWTFRCGEGVTVLSVKDELAERKTITVSDGFGMTCRWSVRRTWYPGQGRMKSEGCVPANADRLQQDRR